MTLVALLLLKTACSRVPIHNEWHQMVHHCHFQTNTAGQTKAISSKHETPCSTSNQMGHTVHSIFWLALHLQVFQLYTRAVCDDGILILYLRFSILQCNAPLLNYVSPLYPTITFAVPVAFLSFLMAYRFGQYIYLLCNHLAFYHLLLPLKFFSPTLYCSDWFAHRDPAQASMKRSCEIQWLWFKAQALFWLWLNWM